MGSAQSGAQVATNIIKDCTQTWTSSSSVTGAMSQCANSIVSEPGCENLNVQYVDQTCVQNLDITSMQHSLQDANVKSDLTNQITQKAEEAVQNMSFNFTSQQSKEISNNIIEISKTIYENATSESFINYLADNNIKCKSGNLTAAHVSQQNIASLVMKNTLDSNQTLIANSKASQLIDQQIKLEQKNALWALAVLVAALSCLIMSPLIGSGYVMAKSGQNGVLLMIIACIFLLSSNIYLDAECVKHSMPVARFPPLLPESLSIPIFPKWCDTNTLMYSSFSITWLVFAGMIYAGYTKTKSPALT